MNQLALSCFTTNRNIRSSMTSIRGNSSLRKSANFFLTTRFSYLVVKWPTVMLKRTQDLLWSILNRLYIFTKCHVKKMTFLFWMTYILQSVKNSERKFTRHEKIKWLFLNRKGNDAELSFLVEQQKSECKDAICLSIIRLILCAYDSLRNTKRFTNVWSSISKCTTMNRRPFVRQKLYIMSIFLNRSNIAFHILSVSKIRWIVTVYNIEYNISRKVIKL